MNGEYIRALPTGRFVEACRPWLSGRRPVAGRRLRRGGLRGHGPGGPGAGGGPRRGARHGRLPLPRPPTVDPDAWAKAMVGTRWRRPSCEAGHRRLRGAGGTTGPPRRCTPPPLAVAESVGRKLGKAQAPIRVAVTGRRVGPPLFEALEVLGPDRTLARLRAAAELVAAGGAGS